MSQAFQKIKEQEDVLETFGKNIIVSASAGSGKTSVMIRKIIKLIIEKDVKVSDLLVLTYTNAAASEMKQKLISEMSKQTNPKVLEQIDDVNLADISTFDSFCQKLAKRYFYILDIDPGFNIIQGSEQKEIERRAFKKAVKNYKKNNYQKYFELFDSYASNRTDKNIYEILTKLNEFVKSVLDYNSFKTLTMELFEGSPNSKAAQIILQDKQKDCKSIKQKLEKLLKLSADFGFEKYCAYIQTLLSFCDIVINATDFAKLIDNVQDFKIETAPKQDKNDETIHPQIKTLQNWLIATGSKSIKDEICSFGSSTVYIGSVQTCKKITQTYFELYEEFIKCYEQIKSSKNVYDYNDIERLTIKLFENAEVKETIKNSYKNIFVDEFQDANAVQEKIIMSLENNNNLFFVGDLKQAIYGFRQSNSKIFEKITKNFSAEENSTSLYLNCNFRTTAKILEYINSIFNVVMTDQTASLDYKNKAQLVPKGNYQNEQSHSVELDILYKEKDKKELATQGYNLKYDQIKTEILNQSEQANFVAEKITKLLGEEIFDVKLQKYRKIEYKDIAILFRTRAGASNFVRAFNNYNIPVLENSNTNIEETYDVSVLINLIKISQNFKNDQPLASVMMSDLFDFSADQMLQIKTTVGEKCFYDCVKNYQKNDEIYQKIQKMLSILQNFDHICTFNGLDKALINIIQQTSYFYKIGHYMGGYTRIKNVNDYIKSLGSSKFNLCRSEYINFLEENTREQKVLSGVTSDNVVNITTMHSSKGLEWPIVIIPALESQFRFSPKTGEVELNEELGVGLKYYNRETREKTTSVFYKAVEQYNKESDFGERLRLLYVALTRAKNRLIMVGQTEKLAYNQFASDRDVRRAPDYLSIIINSMSQADISKINSGEISFNISGDPNFVCNVIDQNKYIIGSETESQNILEDNINPKDISSLAEYIQKPYFNSLATIIAQKNSVSSILKSQDDFVSQNSSPNKLYISEHLSEDVKKNELGSLYHRVIELFDFSLQPTKTEVLKVINTIKANKEFDPAVINCIDVNIIINNIKILQDLCGDATLVKEHTFVMELGYNEIEDSVVDDKVLIQGICDLIIIKNNQTILVDYKYSSLSENALKNKYNKQLYLYSKAIEYGLNKKVDNAYILSLKNAKLIACSPYK